MPPALTRALALSVALCLLSGAAIASDGGEGGEAKPEDAKIVVGKSAPRFIIKTMNPVLSGEEVLSTKAWMGKTAKARKRAVVLSFAASWCKPCKKELPELQKFFEKYREQGVGVAVVSIDKEAEQIEEFRALVVDELKLGMPVGSDKYAIVQRRYDAENLPYLVLLDGHGIVQWHHSGYESGGLAPLEKELERVLAAAPPLPPATPEEGGK